MNPILPILCCLVAAFSTACGPKKSGHSMQARSGAMEPTIAGTDYVHWSEMNPAAKLNRGDMVIVESPTDGGKSVWVRRVIGLEGESIEVKDEGVEVDGVLTKWEILAPKARIGSVEKKGKYLVPKDRYFCLGDNVNNSRDSREFGAFPRSMVIGKVEKISSGP
jgi:signal peptidase I